MHPPHAVLFLAHSSKVWWYRSGPARSTFAESRSCWEQWMQPGALPQILQPRCDNCSRGEGQTLFRSNGGAAAAKQCQLHCQLECSHLLGRRSLIAESLVRNGDWARVRPADVDCQRNPRKWPWCHPSWLAGNHWELFPGAVFITLIYHDWNSQMFKWDPRVSMRTYFSSQGC